MSTVTVKPHYRVSMIGTLPGNEIFSFSVALGPPGAAFPGEGFISVLLDPNDTVYDDIRDDCVTYWQQSQISVHAVLKGIKVAPIGPDGRYSGPAVERTVGGSTGETGTVAGNPQANQIALAVTTHSVADLGRVKGRWFLPMPGVLPGADGRFAEATRDALETAAATFVSNLNNQPGLDVLGLRVVIPSSGRHNKDGSVKIGPANHDVTAVSVGRTLDTIRRRRNKLTEFRGTPTSVS